MDDSQTESSRISKSIAAVLEEGTTAVLVTLLRLPDSIQGLRVGAKTLIKDSGERISTFGHDSLDEAATRQARAFVASREDAKSFKVEEFAPELEQFHGVSILFERIQAELRLVICGAGHVGAALARLGALVGYQVTLIDDRAEFVSRELFNLPSEQGVELVLAKDWAEATLEAIGNSAGVSVAIVTRGHKQDEDCLRAVISANPDYAGMIGSKRRTNIVLDKLREEGADETALVKVRAPIGLDIGAVSPEEVALSILAEIVAERRGGSGASLSAWRRDQTSQE